MPITMVNKTTNYKKLMIVCTHVLNGKPVYRRKTDSYLLCEKCFNHYESYGADQKGCWKIPKNEDISNLKTICKSCANQIVKKSK